MSAQFGKWSFEDKALDPERLDKVAELLAPYGPDSNQRYSGCGIDILYRGFHTTKESYAEVQPHVSRCGAIITWDGRLDNRDELVFELSSPLGGRSTDVELISAAYERWGTNCLAKFIGDWALSIWTPANRSLILAKDPIGQRHLYYSFDGRQISWCTVMEPLVLFTERAVELNEEYIAGFLGCFPAAHLTPYCDIRAVPAASYVFVRSSELSVTKYWDFNPHKLVRYATNEEYEEHFRSLFATAVRRKLRSPRPILAELSGGMDSSSIVCMADTVIARGESTTLRLDTISYYDNNDPRLDELPYLIKVEQRRGRAGHHIDLGMILKKQNGHNLKNPLFFEFDNHRLVATPEIMRNSIPGLFDRYAEYLKSHQYRVVLSGIAGEVATGGYVPTPIPEIQDLLVRGCFVQLFRQLIAWAEKMKRPPLPLLWEVLRGFFRHSVVHPLAPAILSCPEWFKPGFVKRNRAALRWYPSQLHFYPRPSFQHQIQLVEQVRRFLAFRSLLPDPLHEVRYPYLDRDLLEFACAIPREQLVGVGKRRFLMKRAMVGIVPDEILNRKQKVPSTQRNGNIISTYGSGLAGITGPIISSSLGIMDSDVFLQALERSYLGEESSVENLKRSVVLESWLRHLASKGMLTVAPLSDKQPDACLKGRSSAA